MCMFGCMAIKRTGKREDHLVINCNIDAVQCRVNRRHWGGGILLKKVTYSNIFDFDCKNLLLTFQWGRGGGALATSSATLCIEKKRL